MTVPDAADGSQPETDDDAACWRHAKRLRSDHPRWVIIWLAPAREYRAYGRVPGARRDTTLAAATPEELAAAITRAEQAVPKVPCQRGRQ